jgi:hypothetical protein
LADESGYDERVWPQLKKAIEENCLSSRKRFDDWMLPSWRDASATSIHTF